MSDNLSGSPAPAERRDNAAVDDRQTTNTRLAQICYILVCLHILFFNYLLVSSVNIYDQLVKKEDGWVESLSAVGFLMAAIALFAAAWAERRIFPRCAYILAAAAMAVFGGEEISWGQRIIGFETPDFLMGLNTQSEFNIHNIYVVNEAVFDRLWEVSYVLGIAGCAAFFCRKERILGMPTPPILLTLSLLVTMSYTYLGTSALSDFLRTILLWQRGLFLLLIMFALFSRNAMLFGASAASLSIAFSIAYLSRNYHGLYFRELAEYLFCLIAFFYALTALQDQRAARQKIAAAVAAFKPSVALPSMRISPPQIRCKFSINKIKSGYLMPWTAFCALTIAGSVVPAAMVYLDIKLDTAAFKDTYMLTQTIDPTARSNFDVYLNGRDLHYFKQPCYKADVRPTFFLGVFPENKQDLSYDRWVHGFENLDFYFDTAHGSMMLDGACAAMVRLPAHYVIASISTGQYIIEDDGAITNLWIVEFPVGMWNGGNIAR